MTPEQKTKILEFLQKQLLTVISTSQKDSPEAAVIGFAENENLELFFGTFNTTRKYANIKNNPKVAFVIGWSLDEVITVQYEGIAIELEGEAAELAKQKVVTKNPGSARFANDPKQRYFKVEPKWIRYSALKVGDVFEVTI
jgi:uncharacterized pyridoxamine 5'-phosphate oxidase family protein